MMSEIRARGKMVKRWLGNRGTVTTHLDGVAGKRNHQGLGVVVTDKLGICHVGGQLKTAGSNQGHCTEALFATR